MADAGVPTTRVTRRTIRRRIGEITGWEVWNGLGGKATGAGSATTLIDADIYSSALDQRVRRRDYILFLDDATNAADSGKWRYVTETVDSSGTVLWTGNGSLTLTLEEMDPPEEFGRRVVRVEATGADGHIESELIEVDPEDGPDWHIQALMRSMATVAGAAAGTGGAKIVVYDLTNSAAITLDDPDAMTTTARGWKYLQSSFIIPATCYQIAVRLQTVTNTEFSEFAWVQLMNRARTRFALPRRITTKRRIGPVYERVGDQYSEFRRRAWGGNIERREAQGRGVSLQISPAPGIRSLWYYEKVNFPKLTSAYTGGEGGGSTLGLDDDNVTWCSLEWVVQAALVECYKFLIRRDSHEMPDRWHEELAQAQVELSAMQDDYGIEGMLVEDSPKPRGSIILRV